LTLAPCWTNIRVVFIILPILGIDARGLYSASRGLDNELWWVFVMNFANIRIRTHTESRIHLAFIQGNGEQFLLLATTSKGEFSMMSEKNPHSRRVVWKTHGSK